MLGRRTADGWRRTAYKERERGGRQQLRRGLSGSHLRRVARAGPGRDHRRLPGRAGAGRGADPARPGPAARWAEQGDLAAAGGGRLPDPLRRLRRAHHRHADRP